MKRIYCAVFWIAQDPQAKKIKHSFFSTSSKKEDFESVITTLYEAAQNYAHHFLEGGQVSLEGECASGYKADIKSISQYSILALINRTLKLALQPSDECPSQAQKTYQPWRLSALRHLMTYSSIEESWARDYFWNEFEKNFRVYEGRPIQHLVGKTVSIKEKIKFTCLYMESLLARPHNPSGPFASEADAQLYPRLRNMANISLEDHAYETKKSWAAALNYLFYTSMLGPKNIWAKFVESCYEMFANPQEVFNKIKTAFGSQGTPSDLIKLIQKRIPSFSGYTWKETALKHKIKSLEESRSKKSKRHRYKAYLCDDIIMLYFNTLFSLGKYEDLIEFELLLQEYIAENEKISDQKGVENRKALRSYVQNKRREKEEERKAKEALAKKQEELRIARMQQYNRTSVKTNPEDHIARAEAEEKVRQETRELRAQIAEENARLDRQAAEDQKRAEEQARREARLKMDEEDLQADAAKARIETGNPEAHAVYNKIWNGGKITLDNLKALLEELGADYRTGKGSHVVMQIHNIAFKDTEGNLQDELFVEPINSETQEDEAGIFEADASSGGGGGGGGGGPASYSAREVLPLPGNPKGKYLHSYLIRQLKEKFTRMGWDADTLVLKG